MYYKKCLFILQVIIHVTTIMETAKNSVFPSHQISVGTWVCKSDVAALMVNALPATTEHAKLILMLNLLSRPAPILGISLVIIKDAYQRHGSVMGMMTAWIIQMKCRTAQVCEYFYCQIFLLFLSYSWMQFLLKHNQNQNLALVLKLRLILYLFLFQVQV